MRGAQLGELDPGLAEFGRARLHLDLQVLDLGPGALRERGDALAEFGLLLDQHQIELAVGRFTDPLQHNKFEFRPLADEPLRVVVRRGHALARIRKPDWHKLARWPWVLQTLSTPARQLLEEEFARAGVASPEDTIECTSIFATLQLVQSSDAVAVMPESVVRDHVRAELLVALPMDVGRDLKAFGLLTRRDEPLSEVAAAFVAHLQRAAHGGTSRLRRDAARGTPGT